MTGQRLVFDRFGPQGEVVRLESFEVADPPPGHCVVRVKAAPINPADLNLIEGTYGYRPELPAACGLEGYGTVLATADPGDPPVGTGVLFLKGSGTWASHVTVPTDTLLPIEAGDDPIQAAMLKVNPLTALRLIEGFAPGGPPGWLIQNAANSGVGQCVIQVARQLGWKTANLVRRPEVIPTLESLGADWVGLDGPGAKLPDGCSPRLAFNAVGGESATRLMDLLAPGGRLITYGAMSREGVKIPNKFLIFKDLSLHGLWVTRWLREADPAAVRAAYHRLATWMAAGQIKMTVDRTFPLDAHGDALAAAATSGRTGKILFQMPPE